MEAGAVVGDFTLLPKRNEYSSSMDWRDKVNGQYISYFLNDKCVYITDGVILNTNGGIKSHTHEGLYSTVNICRWRKNNNGASLHEGILITHPLTSLDNIKMDIGCSIDRFIKQVLDIDDY